MPSATSSWETTPPLCMRTPCGLEPAAAQRTTIPSVVCWGWCGGRLTQPRAEYIYDILTPNGFDSLPCSYRELRSLYSLDCFQFFGKKKKPSHQVWRLWLCKPGGAKENDQAVDWPKSYSGSKRGCTLTGLIDSLERIRGQ